LFVHVPTRPLAGAAAALQSESHVAAVSVPAEHDDSPDGVNPESHVGWQVDPLARTLAQSPTVPLAGATDASHWASHVIVLRTPAEQDTLPDAVKPALQAGWQVEPLGMLPRQSPTVPLTGAAAASQFATHVAAVSTLAEQVVVPEGVKPALHAGWQAAPLGRLPVQLPTTPLDGAADASQSGMQVAATTLPPEQCDTPDTVKPTPHVGWQVDPLANVPTQVPAAPCSGGAGAGHGATDAACSASSQNLYR
jgi:hypothetical protein